jgi:F-type H+-transporting ATPase subunit b
MEKLGIDPILLVVQVINFGLLMFVLTKVLYKPLLKTIKDRQEKVADIEKEREEIKLERENLEKERKATLEKAQSERKEILAEAKKQADIDKKQIIAKAKAEAEANLLNSESDIKRMKAKLEEDFEREVTDMAMKVSERAIGEIMDKSLQEKTFKKALEALKEVD